MATIKIKCYILLCELSLGFTKLNPNTGICNIDLCIPWDAPKTPKYFNKFSESHI